MLRNLVETALGSTTARLGRRGFVLGLVAGGLAAVSLASVAPARAESDPGEAKVMAKMPLEDLVLGNPDAKITIVEYQSMTCGHCANFHVHVFEELKTKYIDTGKVRFIMREFPLDNLAAAASMLGRCTGSTEKNYALTKVLFEKRSDWIVRDPVPALFEIAKQAGFTQETFNACLQNADLLKQMSEQRAIATNELGVSSTPTFFINGKRFNKPATLSSFEAELDPLIEKNGS